MNNLVRLQVLIPTFNRVQSLRFNLESIENQILKSNLKENIIIIVSDNCSKDGTTDFLKQFSLSTSINFKYSIQAKNIGSVLNVLHLINHSEDGPILFLGDDDYLDKDYLASVIKILDVSTGPINIIPSNYGVDEAGERTGFSRDLDLKTRHFKAGFMACFYLAWRGHQLSGLVFDSKSIREALAKEKVENLYLFIFIVGYSSLHYPSVHLVHLPVAITAPPQASKAWTYGDDGLLPEIFLNFKHMRFKSNLARTVLEYQIIYNQYWRLAMYIKLGIKAFLKAVIMVCVNKNVSIATRISLPLTLPLIFLFKTCQLVLKGELLKTIRRRVEL